MKHNVSTMGLSKAVLLTEKMYECRRAARQLLGAGYSGRMTQLGAILNSISAAKGVNTVQAAIEACEGMGAMTVLQIMAAAVELEEPCA